MFRSLVKVQMLGNGTKHLETKILQLCHGEDYPPKLQHVLAEAHPKMLSASCCQPRDNSWIVDNPESIHMGEKSAPRSNGTVAVARVRYRCSRSRLREFAACTASLCTLIFQSVTPRRWVMKIGFIGAGNVTHTIGRHLITAGHTIVVSNSRGPETLADFVADLEV